MTKRFFPRGFAGVLFGLILLQVSACQLLKKENASNPTLPPKAQSEASISSAPVSQDATPGTADAALSTLTILPASVISDGTSTIMVTVTLKDAFSKPMGGKPVALTSSRGAIDRITSSPVTTNDSGVARFTVKSSVTGAAIFSAVSTSDAVAVSQTGSALFLAATPHSDYQAQNSDGASNLGSSASSSKNIWKNLATSDSEKDGSLQSFDSTSKSGWGGSGTKEIPRQLIFDGVDDFVSFAADTNATADFSFETWVKSSNRGALGKVILSNGAITNSGEADEVNAGMTLKQSRVYPGRLELHLGQRSYADEVMSDTPIGFWRLGETRGRTAYDSSGNKHHAEIYGSDGSYSLGQIHDGFGDSDTSLVLNGTDGYLLAPFLGNPGNSGSVTIETWIKPTVLGGQRNVLTLGDAHCFSYGMILSPGSENIEIQARNSTTNTVVAKNIKVGSWHHVAIVFDGANGAIGYVNGVQTGTAPARTTISCDAGYLEISRLPGGDREFIAGQLDEIAVYGSALSSARIAAHYHAGMKRLSCQSASVLTDSTWHHIAGIFSSAGQVLKLMVNGTQECSISLASASYAGSGNDLRLGRDQDARNSWKGSVAELRTWTTALKNSNVVTHFNASASKFPSFDPSAISSLKLWLKADTGIFQDNAGTKPATVDSEPVGSWLDQSGQENHATQSAASLRPLYRTNILKGHPVVRFDGVDDAMGLTTALNSYPSTVFIVAKNNDTDNGSVVLTSTAVFDVYVSIRGAEDQFWFAHADPQGVAKSPTGVGTRFRLFAGIQDGDKGRSYLNGTQGVEAAGLATNNARTFDSIGGYGTAAWIMDGDIAEILVYGSALSDTHRKRVEAYLNSKYSLY